ncbi:MAG: hypothetical protein QOK46_403 [Microbacteriaceae bacterium]|jgi:uncharacterized membrane protein|nr:cytoplasmic protein [Microbacteriaceae bacterium]MDQ1553325.1 hypothetical protein [Microbacteriaceae bacterium]
MSKRVLLAGESWTSFGIHTKGMTSYETATYEEGAEQLIAVLRAEGAEVTYMPNHRVVEGFPYDVDELASSYDVIILSDVPADSFLLPHAVFVGGERRPNRLAVISEFVRRGGGLIMVGGYMSFSGYEGRARFGLTPLAEILPVSMMTGDDRLELPEGVVPTVVSGHEIVTGLPEQWPYFLGYNKFEAKPGSTVVMSANDDPFLVVDTIESGRVVAFASDCSPHWGSPAFMEWGSYSSFWNQMVDWAAGDAA